MFQPDCGNLPKSNPSKMIQGLATERYFYDIRASQQV